MTCLAPSAASACAYTAPSPAPVRSRISSSAVAVFPALMDSAGDNTPLSLVDIGPHLAPRKSDDRIKGQYKQ